MLLTSHGYRVQALPLALLATALGLGEVTAANRDAAAASARLAHDAERSRFARELHDVIVAPAQRHCGAGGRGPAGQPAGPGAWPCGRSAASRTSPARA